MRFLGSIKKLIKWRTLKFILEGFFILLFCLIVRTSLVRLAVEPTILSSQGEDTFNPVENSSQTVSNTKDTEDDFYFDFEEFNLDFSLPPRTIKKPVYKMPASYLSDEIEFVSLDYDAWQGQEIAVVAKDNVFLYEDILAKRITDLSMLENKKLALVPKGTVVPLLKRYSSGNKDKDPFLFNNHYNYWYRTIYNGKQGIIFGAYLLSTFSDFKSKSHISLINKAYLYRKPQRETKFYDNVGNRRLTEKIKACLSKNKLAFEKVNKNEYILSADSPDDLLALYQEISSDETATIYLTCDLLIHCLHLFFDRLLQDLEKKRFLPILAFLVNDYLAELTYLESQLKPSSQVMREAVQNLKGYFLVAEALLQPGLKARKISLERQNQIDFFEEEFNVEAETFDNDYLYDPKYPEAVKKELSLIYQAKSVAISPLYNGYQDYSMFKPRGHYTRSPELKAYFRAMMWLGLIHFYLDNSDLSLLQNKNGTEVTITRFDKSVAQVSQILVLSKITKENKRIFNKWAFLYNVISYLIGKSDDLNFYDLEPVLTKVDLNQLETWLAKRENLERFIREATPLLRPSRIHSNPDIAFDRRDDKELGQPPAQGFRLFGQRFSLDSFIFDRLSGFNVIERTMVKGLDVMAVLGNETARKLLQDDFNNVVFFKENFNALRDYIKGQTDDDWRMSFYNSYLKLVQELTTFGQGQGFYFTQTPKWEQKALLTSHAAWAELRHDTILYLKQSNAEKGGNGFDIMFDLDPVPRPIHYVEPNLGFYYWLEALLKDSFEVLDSNKLLEVDYLYKYIEFINIAEKLIAIVEKEALNQPISPEQNDFITGVFFKLARIVLPVGFSIDSYTKSDDQFKMALVADVHTDAKYQKILEVATGIPYRIYVALNDGQGGKRIAIGYTYSYYEFELQLPNRLTDEEWKKLVYGSASPQALDIYLPAWAKDICCQ